MTAFYMNYDLKSKIIHNIKLILLNKFPTQTKEEIDSMCEFIYKASVVLVDEYIESKQKLK